MRHSTRKAMAQEAGKQARERKQRGYPILRGIAALVLTAALFFGGYQALTHPDTPLPGEWNPTKPLLVADPVTPITSWKLNRALATPNACIAALAGAANLFELPDFEDSDQCHIRNRVDLRAVGGARLDPLETRCAIALRLAMWEQHSLQPAAQEILGTSVTAIQHFGSYSCRTIRTSSGPSTRMSTHATADAVDISGFTFANGQTISLQRDWGTMGPEADFLRAARDGACDWFSLTLSPFYNALHADHFHLQSRGWGLCR